MPFKSKAQLRKFFELEKQGKITDAQLQEWIASTPNIAKLPERIKPKSKKGRNKNNKHK